ncbi:MAG: peptidase M50 family protein [Chloroflexi bacterium]|nr:MAG: peptidase M50 family protein [Chloroflexota bacterium]MBA4375061.1 site-2 protease family protein [Anaerolinea sp.]
METMINYESIDALVKRIFFIEDITLGSAQERFLMRYRGRLVSEDTATAYDQLAVNLKPHGLTPLFRIEEKQHVILLVSASPTPKPGRPMFNLVMFLLTLVSVLLSGGLFNLGGELPTNPTQAVLAIIRAGWPFAVSLLAILGAHEFGHYFAGRAHGVKVSLPFFIPMPFSYFGTMGAFINMKEPPKNKRVLMDIAVAGPIAGYVVSIIVILLGLSLSTLSRIPLVFPEGQGLQIEGNSVTYLLLKWLRFGQLLPLPASYGDLNPIVYWLRYFFTGRPFPLGGLDVMIHPVAWAGWAGLLVTSLNLIPAGQLDGGHIFSLLFGKKGAKRVLPFILAILVGLGFLWSGWWLWAGLVFLFGRVYAEPLDQITELDDNRKVLGTIALFIFLLTFTPIPLSILL